MIITKFGVVLCLILTINFSGFSQNKLVSGEPIKSNTDVGYGRFALPSINAFAMGMVDVNDDGHQDLFIQADRWNPGTYVYYFEGYTDTKEPIFSEKKKITIPFDDEIQNKAILIEEKEDNVLGFWGVGDALKYADFDKKSLSFGDVKSMKVKGLPRNFSNFGIIELSDSNYLILFSVIDKEYKRYPGRGPNVITYGSDGIWDRPIPKSGIYGAFVSSLDQNEIQAKLLTTETEAYYSIEGFALKEVKNQKYLLCGTRLGNIHSYKIDEENEKISNQSYVVDQFGVTMRNPAIHGALTSFDEGLNSGVIISSEGGIYYYKFDEGIDENGKLVFGNPSHLLQSNADLYGSSLVVPNLVDWDGDNDLDIISGTSIGYIQFIENVGDNSIPKFNIPVELEAGGHEILVQPGYNQDIQGPGESRWGYTCPIVTDWTGNGLPDILTGDSRGKFNVYINSGTKTAPYLEPEKTLYIDGMDMFGTWRVRPGVGKLGDKMAYICLDSDDEFHLYWKLDKYNLTDGGKLKLKDDKTIRANLLNAGATGRSKILIEDWDEDGVKDLLVGTPRHGSIPEPINGLPFHLDKNGASVIFLKNIGTEEQPVYSQPKMLKFKGEPILLGQHSCAPTVGEIGPGNTKNLIVGDETGRFIYYQKKDIEY